ncbi:alpha/beta fold hydrolase [Hymenobacter aquaticus]|uniref:Alpha/beta fold hydrolase n=1 Tax=Hymenobacter aquaticus TaxID=1867101 RepID=A0A4Z0Q1F9_9BACT|nr:alpha/beta fold hydrolase [Hymenobacter aquaticus]TGE23817.1 alpha/beta fold hydrolase [Hymenobacter aquaticus]
MPLLHYIDLPGPNRPIVVLHCILGSADEWEALARRWARELHHRVILVDLRNHGRSFHAPDHTIRAMAVDILRLLDALGLPDEVVLLGHSMGAKVAMRLALSYPARVASLICLDMSPGPDDLTYVDHLLAVLRRLEADGLPGPTQTEALLAAEEIPPAIRHYVLQNLAGPAAGPWYWRVNLAAIAAATQDLAAALTAPSRCNKPASFVRAATSGYVTDYDLEFTVPALFAGAQVTTIADAGHFLHLDKPDAIFAAVATHLAMHA